VEERGLSLKDLVFMPLIIVQIIVLHAAGTGLAVAEKHLVTTDRVNKSNKKLSVDDTCALHEDNFIPTDNACGRYR
jgi:hypothetical protein